MKIVVAYSGGLDTSVAIVWLKEKYDAEIVGFCADVGQVNEPVTGTARLRLYKGGATLIGRSSPRSLYRNDIVTFEDDRGAFDQKDAGGFIRLNALRLRTTAAVKDPG
jgi:argininosuccinate synthase